MKKISLGAILLAVLLLVVACGGGGGELKPTITPTAAAPPQAVQNYSADPEDIALGGRIYDNWWKAVDGATEPTSDNPLWSLQSSNTRSGGETWRCKECHGWDYAGDEGAYGSGSHYTGFPGILDAVWKLTKVRLVEQLTGKIDSKHDFSSELGEDAIEKLVSFVKEGLIDTTEYIDYSTKAVLGADVAHGQDLFTSTCAACHGADGKLIDFGDGEGIGALANDNPWETLHKIRFGQPGTAMPSGIASGWSDQDAVDVLGYSQTLPE